MEVSLEARNLVFYIEVLYCVLNRESPLLEVPHDIIMYTLLYKTDSNCPIYLLLGFEVLQNFPPYIHPQKVLCSRDFLIQGAPLNPTVVNSQQQHLIWIQSIIAHGSSQSHIQGILNIGITNHCTAGFHTGTFVRGKGKLMRSCHC